MLSNAFGGAASVCATIGGGENWAICVTLIVVRVAGGRFQIYTCIYNTGKHKGCFPSPSVSASVTSH